MALHSKDQGLARRALAVMCALCMLLLAGMNTSTVMAQEAPLDLDDEFASQIRTDSPRETFASFQRLSAEMEDALASYLAEPSFAGVSRLALLSDQMNSLIDLSLEAPSSRREVGIRTMTFLSDIFGRIPPIDPETLLDADQIEEDGRTSVRIPDTPIYISRIEDGERQGEYLFSASTVDVAPRFFRAVQSMPLRTDLPIQSLTSLGPQLTGPVVPPGVVAAIPPSLRTLWLGTPLWKVVLTAVAFLLSLIVLLALYSAIARPRAGWRVRQVLLQSMLPIATLLFTSVLLPAFTFQLNLSGTFADIVGSIKTVITHIAYAWLFWLVVRLAVETVILSPRIADQSLDANLLRLIANVLGFIGTVVILAFGGQAIGIPILSVLAGLGIGGLAVALALRPTLENLVGGVILYMDRPVRVGDFCRFGEQTGTIEAIGLRSTKLRALDRTLISVPNAQFADMQITNFAYCDRMLIGDTIGIRYETEPDQLRHLLATMRLMLHAHPRIDDDTVRVRFAGYGDYSLNIDIRVYVNTQEWNDFFAVREDIYLRLYDLVSESGTGFAFPSQTLYMARDAGMDTTRADAASATVGAWRASGKLPFPKLAASQRAAVQGSLDYPPKGSPDAGRDAELEVSQPETLSSRSVEDQAEAPQKS